MTQLSHQLPAQTISLPGVPPLTNQQTYERQRITTYVLPVSTLYENLELTDKLYLKPMTETVKIIKGKYNGSNYFVTQFLNNQPIASSLEYQLSHIVTNDSLTRIYDISNLLISSKITASPVSTLDSISETEWDSVIILSTGITKYLAEDLVMVEDTNTGNLYAKYIGWDGKDILVFENHEIVNGELHDLNFRMMAIPATAPSGMCITRLFIESFSNRTGEGIEPRQNSSLNEKYSIRLNPNPVINQLNIVLSGLTDDKTYYRVMDMKGSLLLSSIVHTDQFNLDVTDIPPGIYILQVYNKHQTVTEKFIKL